MKKFIMMMGIPGSGKSTHAKNVQGAVVISSDELRLEHYVSKGIDETNRGAIFALVNEKIKEEVNKGTEIIVFDATNLSSKRRINFLKDFNNWCRKSGQEYEKEIRVMGTDHLVCIDNIQYRKGTSAVNEVNEEILLRMISHFEIPYAEEGWDNIHLCWELNKFESINEDELNKTLDFDQNTIHHNQTVLEHSRTVRDVLVEQHFPYPTCGLYHDIGKPFVKEDYFHEELGIMQSKYPNHANCSAFIVLTQPMLNASLTKEEFLEMLFIINYHMLPMQWTEKNIAKQVARYGQKKVDLLLRFNKADKYRKED